ncbi:amidohydrolase family protein [Candidatus Woesearchaeota archaeon]|nr:amidohydrolase family protein [Candidatus Woesearchaeota archaeon]
MVRIKYPWNKQISKIYKLIIKDSPIVDSHVHLGLDDDGEATTPEGIIREMNKMNVTRSAIFPFSNPDREDDFHKPNQRIFDACKKYPDRFIPFFRLDPKKKWKKELELRVKQGFVGIKLHPVRQKFRIDSKDSVEIFKRAKKYNLVVLIHTGLGMSELSQQIKSLLAKVPDVKIILGHSAFVDMNKVIKAVKDKPNVYFEISAIRVFDFYNLITNISSKRILFGTDYPFYNLPLTIELLIGVALTYKKNINLIKNMLGKTFQNMLKSTELFNKKKIKNIYIHKTRNKKHYTIDLYKLTKRSFKLITNLPFLPIKTFIDKISSIESRKNANRIVHYLRIYTFLNGAEVLLEKESFNRAYNRLKIIRNITKEPFDKKEEVYINLIRKTVNKIINDKKNIVKNLRITDYNIQSEARTNIRIAKNICITRMLKVE